MPHMPWYFSAFPGHFICAEKCRFHLNTRIGPYRVSSVGDYHPSDADGKPQPIGNGRLFETMVFRLTGNGLGGDPNDPPEGIMANAREIAAKGYNDSREAEAGHYALCQRFDAIAWGELTAHERALAVRLRDQGPCLPTQDADS